MGSEVEAKRRGKVVLEVGARLVAMVDVREEERVVDTGHEPLVHSVREEAVEPLADRPRTCREDRRIAGLRIDPPAAVFGHEGERAPRIFDGTDREARPDLEV